MGIPCYMYSDWTSRAKTYNELLCSSLKHIDIFSKANWYDLYDFNTKAASDAFMEDVKHPNSDGFYRTKRISAENHVYKSDWYFQRH